MSQCPVGVLLSSANVLLPSAKVLSAHTSYGTSWPTQNVFANCNGGSVSITCGLCPELLRHQRGSNFMPVQAPTKYELVIKFKIAKVLGLAVPPSLVTRADEVIE